MPAIRVLALRRAHLVAFGFVLSDELSMARVCVTGLQLVHPVFENLPHLYTTLLLSFRWTMVVHASVADAVVKDVSRCGARAYAHQADVTNEAQVQAMFQQMVRRFGTIDILVNNAGIQKDAAFDEMTLAQWQKVIDVNLTGQFLCAREAIREFKRRGVVPDVSCSAGKIICISSVHDVIPWAGHVNYAASKGPGRAHLGSIKKATRALTWSSARS